MIGCIMGYWHQLTNTPINTPRENTALGTERKSAGDKDTGNKYTPIKDNERNIDTGSKDSERNVFTAQHTPVVYTSVVYTPAVYFQDHYFTAIYHERRPVSWQTIEGGWGHIHMPFHDSFRILSPPYPTPYHPPYPLTQRATATSARIKCSLRRTQRAHPYPIQYRTWGMFSPVVVVGTNEQ